MEKLRREGSTLLFRQFRNLGSNVFELHITILMLNE